MLHHKWVKPFSQREGEGASQRPSVVSSPDAGRGGKKIPSSPLARILFFSHRPQISVKHNTNTDIIWIFEATYTLFNLFIFNSHIYVLSCLWDGWCIHRDR